MGSMSIGYSKRVLNRIAPEHYDMPVSKFLITYNAQDFSIKTRCSLVELLEDYDLFFGYKEDNSAQKQKEVVNDVILQARVQVFTCLAAQIERNITGVTFPDDDIAIERKDGSIFSLVDWTKQVVDNLLTK